MNTPGLPISKKAYTRFCERIRRINATLGTDSAYMLDMLDEYLAGNKHPGDDLHPQQDFAFLFLRDEIDLAITRSTRAREAARLRRERKPPEKRHKEKKIPDNNTPQLSPEEKRLADEKYARQVESYKKCVRMQLYPEYYNQQSQPRQRDDSEIYSCRPHEILRGYRYVHPLWCDEPVRLPDYDDDGDEENDSPYRY